MALIENATPKKKSSYTRLFGIESLGLLMTKVHSTMISAGTELETILYEKTPHKIKDETLDDFLRNPYTYGASGKRYVVNNKQIKKSEILKQKKKSKIQSKSYEPDFLVFDVGKKKLYILEVKDGMEFDTKKSSAEHDALHQYNTMVASSLPFARQIFLCSFNEDDKDKIYEGLKRKFTKEEIMTGKELCKLMSINYEDIVKKRTSHQPKNVEHFVIELLKIRKIKNMLLKRLNTND